VRCQTGAKKEVIGNQWPVTGEKPMTDDGRQRTERLSKSNHENTKLTKARKGALFRVFPLSCFRDKFCFFVYVPASKSRAKKHVDKVSFAGIFNELLILVLVSFFEMLVGSVSPEMPFRTGLEKGGDSHNRGS
jgi:hypothetical protein